MIKIQSIIMVSCGSCFLTTLLIEIPHLFMRERIITATFFGFRMTRKIVFLLQFWCISCKASLVSEICTKISICQLLITLPVWNYTVLSSCNFFYNSYVCVLYCNFFYNSYVTVLYYLYFSSDICERHLQKLMWTVDPKITRKYCLSV